MGSQFAHIDLWTAAGTKTRGGGYRWSAREILQEMGREDGACEHVDIPQEPIQLYGIQPIALADELDDIASGLRDSRGRNISKSARVLMAAVYSYPIPRSEADVDDEEAWAADAIRFNLKYFGKENVRSIVAHTDEKHFHIHVAIVAPLRGARMAWEEVHPGLAADSGAKAVEASGKRRRNEYIKAMRSFQDAFYRDVSIKHGHTRAGPRRRRLNREEWHTEQSVQRLISQSINKPLEDVLSAVMWKERYEKEKARADQAEKHVEKLRRQVMRLIEKLRSLVKEKIRRRTFATMPISELSKQIERDRVRQSERRIV